MPKASTASPTIRSAAYWFRKAADYGVTDSQYNLGILYARGIGVETNLAEAYKWFALAAREGDSESAKKRDEVGARLDQAPLAAARAAVQVVGCGAAAGGRDPGQDAGRRLGRHAGSRSRQAPRHVGCQGTERGAELGTELGAKRHSVTLHTKKSGSTGGPRRQHR